jgi:hypothetical protein
MFESFRISWRLFKVSWNVLGKDKEIMIFPVLCGAALTLLWLIFLVSFIFFFILNGVIFSVASSWLFWVTLFLIFFLLILGTYFIAIFFEAAIIGCATIRLNGGDPTVKDGLRIASSRIGKLFGWAVIAATVGIIVQILASYFRRNLVAQFVLASLEMAWGIAIMFVVPVILYENLGGFKAVKRSAYIIKHNFGVSLISQFTLSLVALPFILLGTIVLLAGLIIMVYSIILGILLIIAAIASFLVLAVVFTALAGIMLAALYKYARTGTIGSGYDEILNAGGLTVAPAPAAA